MPQPVFDSAYSFLESRGYRGEVGLRLGHGDSGLETANDVVRMASVGCALIPELWLCGENLNARRIVKTLRHYTNHGARHSVERNGLVDNLGVAAETTLPQTMRENGNRVLTRLIFVVGKASAQRRFHSQDIQEISGNEKTLYAFRCSPSR